MSRAPLALTLGDPAGIGPEITVKAWRALRRDGPAFMVIGDAAALASAAGRPAAIRAVSSPAEAASVFGDVLPVLDLPLPGPIVPGGPDASAAPAIIRWIETAVELALSGEVAGLVTAPIAKAPLYAAGFRFPGHTEFLGELTSKVAHEGVRGPVMMLAAGDLRTTLVTIHEPLARVSGLLTVEAILRTVRITAEALIRDFGIARPRLALAGLNPHAGESGSIGREEIEIIAPAAGILRAEGLDLRGPLPADSLFHADARAT